MDKKSVSKLYFNLYLYLGYNLYIGFLVLKSRILFGFMMKSRISVWIHSIYAMESRTSVWIHSIYEMKTWISIWIHDEIQDFCMDP